jgi:hypothetical protein
MEDLAFKENGLVSEKTICSVEERADWQSLWKMEQEVMAPQVSG